MVVLAKNFTTIRFLYGYAKDFLSTSGANDKDVFYVTRWQTMGYGRIHEQISFHGIPIDIVLARGCHLSWGTEGAQHSVVAEGNLSNIA
jgi:hypothetical protein